MIAGTTVCSDRVLKLKPPATVAVSNKARQLKAQGVDVIDLGGGDPDFPTPAHIVDAAVEALRSGNTHYVASRGIPELLDAIAAKFERENGVKYDPKTEILVTPSGKHALFSIMMALCNEGDEVLVLDPAWVTYEAVVEIAEGVAKHVPLTADDNYRVTEAKLRPHLTERTKAIIVNSPSNPTGRVLDREEVEAIANIVRERDLIVISDEMYEHIIYDGRQNLSFAALPDLRDRTITVNGFSKAFAMTGWRLGYLGARAELLSQILKIHEQSVTCAASFAQVAGVAALNGPHEVVAKMTEVYCQRRDLVVKGYSSLPGVHCPDVEGAFYALPDVSGTGMDGTEFADFALTQARVALTPGIAFGESSRNSVRLSFATATELLEESIRRLDTALRAR
ncbi:MAG: pyridoxal phosphate-dependent aminotransferase [Chloroflexi bacterium]|nr:pyridoxal phosphate-dependent aminotransferase [Chloroflexota bacterium]